MLWRTLRRLPRPDLPDGCVDAVDRDMLREIWTYPRRERRRLAELLAAVDAGVTVYRVRSDREAGRLLAKLAEPWVERSG